MTIDQKNQITALRRQNVPFSKISEQTGIPISTVKSYCRRNHVEVVEKASVEGEEAPLPAPNIAPDTPPCLQCGKPLPEKCRSKKFCSKFCKDKMWKAKRRADTEALRSGKNIGGVTKDCEYCGKPFFPIGSDQRYCSRDCVYKGRYGPEHGVVKGFTFRHSGQKITFKIERPEIEDSRTTVPLVFDEVAGRRERLYQDLMIDGQNMYEAGVLSSEQFQDFKKRMIERYHPFFVEVSFAKDDEAANPVSDVAS